MKLDNSVDSLIDIRVQPCTTCLNIYLSIGFLVASYPRLIWQSDSLMQQWIQFNKAYYHWTTFWLIFGYSICSDLVFDLLAFGMFEIVAKHLIYSLTNLLHRNLWMGCYASVEQVWGPPFDKMSHSIQCSKSAKFKVQRQKLNQFNDACFDVLVRVWTCPSNVIPSNAAAGADSNTSIT